MDNITYFYETETKMYNPISNSNGSYDNKYEMKNRKTKKINLQNQQVQETEDIIENTPKEYQQIQNKKKNKCKIGLTPIFFFVGMSVFTIFDTVYSALNSWKFFLGVEHTNMFIWIGCLFASIFSCVFLFCPSEIFALTIKKLMLIQIFIAPSFIQFSKVLNSNMNQNFIYIFLGYLLNFTASVTIFQDAALFLAKSIDPSLISNVLYGFTFSAIIKRIILLISLVSFRNNTNFYLRITFMVLFDIFILLLTFNLLVHSKEITEFFEEYNNSLNRKYVFRIICKMEYFISNSILYYFAAFLVSTITFIVHPNIIYELKGFKNEFSELYCVLLSLIYCLFKIVGQWFQNLSENHKATKAIKLVWYFLLLKLCILLFFISFWKLTSIMNFTGVFRDIFILYLAGIFGFMCGFISNMLIKARYDGIRFDYMIIFMNFGYFFGAIAFKILNEMK